MKPAQQTTLANINLVRFITNTLGEGFKKKYGQNFLINQKSLLRFIHAIDPEAEDTLIEIGPGIGIITYSLCERAQMVYCVEIDRGKEAALEKTLENFSNYQIIWADAKKVNYQNIPAKEKVNRSTGQSFKVTGSLPYNAAKPIIHNLFTSGSNWSTATFFLQKEVAERYVSRPPHSEFLAMFTSVYADSEIKFFIPPKHFMPIPKVDTAVIQFTRTDDYKHLDRNAITKFIKRGFMQPRKTVLNNLKQAGLTAQMLLDAGLDDRVRPSQLTLQNWIRLYESLH